MLAEIPPNKKNKVKVEDHGVLTDFKLDGKEFSSRSRLYSNPNYASQVLQNLNSLRHESKFCDIEIRVGNKVIKAHKAVLSACSPYFQAMFTSGLIEETQSSIELRDVSPQIIDELIEFMYTGNILIRQDTVIDLISASDMLELKQLVKGCTDYLKLELHSSNAVGIYRFSESRNCEELTKASRDYINTNFPEICFEEEFLDLPREQVISFFKSEDLCINSELEVFQAALRWIMHDVSSRRCFVFEILSHIRFTLFPIDALVKAIEDCSDNSLKVAMRSVKKDLQTKQGNFVCKLVEPRISAKKYIFVIGGSKREVLSTWTRSECTYSSVERYDPFSNTWDKVAPMGIGRILPGVATLGGKIYVIGGEQESQILANGERYDPKMNEWNSIKNMIVPRCEFGLCALHENLYAFGGWVGEDIGGSIERYSPLKNEWVMAGSLPEPRFSMGVVAFEDLIYIVGGCTHSRRQMQDLLSYNPVTGEWTNLTPMLTGRSQMGVAVLNRCLYVVGGTSRGRDVLQSVERYSFDENKWYKVPAMTITRASPAVAALHGLLYVIGGDQTHEVNFYRAQTTLVSVECYDPALNKWFECPPLSESRSEAKAIVA